MFFGPTRKAHMADPAAGVADPLLRRAPRELPCAWVLAGLQFPWGDEGGDRILRYNRGLKDELPMFWSQVLNVAIVTHT